ncbi:MAG: hypothetical protein U1F83_03465 [Verrucomicrobiota bacterium]
MKPNSNVSKFNFALIALVIALAGAVFLTGCASSDGGGTDHSAHQGSCH